jgi:hypothetical protein
MNESSEHPVDETTEAGYEPPSLTSLGSLDDVTRGFITVKDGTTTLED